IRLTRVDLPTFGRPTTATTGSRPGSGRSPPSPVISVRSASTQPSSSTYSPVTSILRPIGCFLPDPAGSGSHRPRPLADERALRLARAGPFLNDPEHLGDHLVERERGGVQLHGVGGLGQRGDPAGRVERVAPGQL